jgi:HEPN domain-containing protein
MDSKAELVKNWLIKSQHDLLAAQKLSSEPEIYADVAIYHCQQSAEKALKGFLILYDQTFPRTHDVRLLLQLAIVINPRLFNLTIELPTAKKCRILRSVASKSQCLRPNDRPQCHSFAYPGQ